jgi:hypothetical protein
VGGEAVSTDTWIDRVREADAEAEKRFQYVWAGPLDNDSRVAEALIAIAAELRAARIARRPGVGQK